MSVIATCHLQIEGELRGENVVGAKVVGFTQGPPGRPRPGTLAIKVALKVPDAAFLRMIPEALVEIPDGWWTSTPVVVTSEPPAMEELT